MPDNWKESKTQTLHLEKHYLKPDQFGTKAEKNTQKSAVPLGKQYSGLKKGRQHFEGKKKQNITATLRTRLGMAICSKNKCTPEEFVQAADRDLAWAEESLWILFLHKFLPGKEKQRWYEKKHFKIMCNACTQA